MSSSKISPLESGRVEFLGFDDQGKASFREVGISRKTGKEGIISEWKIAGHELAARMEMVRTSLAEYGKTVTARAPEYSGRAHGHDSELRKCAEMTIHLIRVLGAYGQALRAYES